MYKALFPLITAMFLILSLSTACAEQDPSDQATGQSTKTEQAKESGKTEQGESLLDQPVDFSNAEAVEKTLQNIREQEGEAAYENLKVAMDYILFYDMSVRNDKAKLYKKLNGQTPKQIFARMKR